MRGSIAIWQDTFPIDAEGYAPRVEVHINIWRNSQRKKREHYDLFDIGLRFEELRALRSLSISLPFVVLEDQVSDLFETMHEASTLSAIFNETLTPGSILDGGHHFSASHTENKGVQFFVWRCSADERKLSTIGEGCERSTVLTLSDQFFNRLRPRIGDHYLRIRIKIPTGLENGFVSSNDPRDSVFLSTFSTSEIIEFRLNERRNLPNAIRDRLQAKDCGLIDISAVRYFLIRDMGVEMTQSHTGFKKMRRLESGIWDRYLASFSGFSPDRMIIYHWASFPTPPLAGVESFTALATFRAYYTDSLWLYGLVIVLLGAMGSAAQNEGAAILAAMLEPLCLRYVSEIANGLLLILLVVALVLLVHLRRRKT